MQEKVLIYYAIAKLMAIQASIAPLRICHTHLPAQIGTNVEQDLCDIDAVASTSVYQLPTSIVHHHVKLLQTQLLKP